MLENKVVGGGGGGGGGKDLWNTKIQYVGKLQTSFCIKVGSTYNTTHK